MRPEGKSKMIFKSIICISKVPGEQKRNISFINCRSRRNYCRNGFGSETLLFRDQTSVIFSGKERNDQSIIGALNENENLLRRETDRALVPLDLPTFKLISCKLNEG